MHKSQTPKDEEFKVHSSGKAAGGFAGNLPIAKALLLVLLAALVVWGLVQLVGGSDATAEVAAGQQQLNQRLLEAVQAADEASQR